MTDLLRTRPAATPAMLAVWSDAATIGHALAFEAALAAAQAAEGLIPAETAEMIARACDAMSVDPSILAEEVALAGTLAIPLVRRLRALSGGAADAVHGGATSQDVADTVLMIQAQGATALLCDDCDRLVRALHPVARRHADTPAIGRILLQDAAPIGWGLRIAHWAAGIDDATDRLRHEMRGAGVVQLGGAAGTLAGMDGRGRHVAEQVGITLGLDAGPPWHARRGGLAGIAAALGILIGAIAKMARDVSLLAQPAVGEAREPIVAGRGGSSAMAHKRNPTGCQVALSAATRAPGLVAGVLTAMPAEWERGLGGWQAEGPMLADLFLLASGAADAMATVAQGLDVDEAAIARNLDAATTNRDIGDSVPLTHDLLDRKD